MKMKHKAPQRPIISTLVLGLATLSLASAQQEQQDWVTPTGGSFGLPANWDSAVPTAGDLAWFNLAESSGYTVQLDQDRSTGTLQVANDNVILDLGGFNFGLTDSSSGSWDAVNDFTGTSSLMIGRGIRVEGNTESHTGSLTIGGGGAFSTTGLVVGGVQGSTGALTVEGAGTVFNSSGTGINAAIFGFLGDAEFTLRDGAIANFGYVTIGRHSASTAAVTVEGADTEFNVDYLNIGPRGDSNMVVRNGAHLEVPTDSSGEVVIAERHRDAALTIDNATASLGRTRVGLHSTAADGRGKGELNVLNGSNVAVGDSENYRHLTVATATAAAMAPVGIVRVDNSQLSVSGRLILGGVEGADQDGDGRLYVTNGGEVTTGGNLNLWSKSTVHVEGGSSLTIAALDGVAGGTLQTVLRSGEFAPLITTRAGATIDGLILVVTIADDFTAEVNDTFRLLAYNNNLAGTFADLDEGDTITVGGYDFLLSYGEGSNDFISLQVTAIPEPGTTAAIFAALALLLVMARMRK